MTKLDEIVKGIFMNRISFLGISCVIGGLTGIVTGAIKRDISIAGCSVMTFFTGVYLLGVTEVGSETYNSYERTKSHIQEHGRLSKHFVRTFSQQYCDRQGVYIAAKELGCLNTYKKATKLEGAIRILNF